MSIEIGVPSKSIRYLNIHKEGLSGENNFCHVDSRWTTPILDKLDDYMVAVTRFEVPANRLTMTQKLTDCIEIYRYPEESDKTGGNDAFVDLFKDNKNVEDIPGTRLQALTEIEILEEHPAGTYCMTKGVGAKSITVEACHTIYQFIKALNSKINECLLFNTGNKKFKPNGAGHPADAAPFTRPASDHAEHTNMFTLKYHNQDAQDNAVINTTDPIAFFKIVMDSDWRFSVCMNYNFAQKYYIKFSHALFNMLGFREGTSAAKEDIRIDMAGRRFMGSRKLKNAVADNDIIGMMDQKPVYVPENREIIIFDRAPRILMNKSTTDQRVQRDDQDNIVVDSNGDAVYETYNSQGYEYSLTASVLENRLVHRSNNTIFTAPVSVADSINRVKSLVFTSSMATSSEGATGGTYFRMLTDYTIPVKTSFSFNPYTMEGGSVNENAASEYTFTNANPSAGRFLQLTDPSPLYELKLEVLAKVFNYEKDRFEMEAIPLPIGGTFSVKLVFISKNEIHRREAPDAMKP